MKRSDWRLLTVIEGLLDVALGLEIAIGAYGSLLMFFGIGFVALGIIISTAGYFYFREPKIQLIN